MHNTSLTDKVQDKRHTHQYTQHYYGFPASLRGCNESAFSSNLMKGACSVPSRAIGRLLATSIIE